MGPIYYIWKHLQNQEGSDGKFVNKVWDLCTIYEIFANVANKLKHP